MSVTKNTGLAERGLNAAFKPAFKDAESLTSMIATLVNSDGASETYKWLGQNPTIREWKDRIATKALRDFGFTITNKDWEIGLAIDKNELEDDQLGQLASRGTQLGVRYKQGPDKIITQLIEAGEAGTLGLAYDGQYFFDTDHSEGDSGTQSNDLTYAAATGTTPTYAEFEAAFWQAVQAMVAFKDDQGEPWSNITNVADISKLMLYVPPSMMEVATKLVSPSAVQLANNTTNILAGKCKLFINPRSTWTDKFAVLDTDGAERPFIFQSRSQPKTSLVDDPKEKFVEYLVTGRFNVGYGLWQKAVLTTFT